MEGLKQKKYKSKLFLKIIVKNWFYLPAFSVPVNLSQKAEKNDASTHPIYVSPYFTSLQLQSVTYM